ncbi:sensor histidine kinase [Sphingomonas phyllosphaerae]|uniref:sensor histidine kinase n=1 Tax=Sphingomonas phyllosphaerae TaxID=257003 RepID=UPI002FFC67C1
MIDGLVAWSFDRPLSAAAQYLLTALVILTVAVARVLFVPDSLPWLLFIPATIGISLVTGRRAGLFAAGLSTVSGILSIGSSSQPYWLTPEGWVAAGLFLLVMLGLVALVAALRDSMRRARQLNGDLVESERRALDREAFLSGVLSSSTDCIKVIELDGTISFMSERGMEAMDISDFNAIRACPWPELLNGNGPEQARRAMDAAKRGETTHFEAPADTVAGRAKHWSISVSPIAGSDGKVARILSVSRDYTELHRAREQQELLNGELAHRIKNTISVVQAIAHQTLDKVEDQEAVATFGARLSALASANTVLTRDSFSSATITDVANSALATFGEDRFLIDGPAVTIGPRATLALTLMLHELATNAAKYGALNVPTGHVTLSWTLCHIDDQQTLQLCWVERGGPPAVQPSRKGFGSRIIRMGLSGSGGVEQDYEEDGLTVRATAPLYQLQEA